jgi:thiamine-phosphate pyrophosphorylase
MSASASAPAPRLLLVTPPLVDGARRDRLDALLRGGAFASVLLDLAAADERTLQRLAQDYAAIARANDVAALAPAGLDTRLIGRAGLDGVQVSGLERLEAALAAMRPDRVVGVAGLSSRDDAMTAGEREPDYLLFGEPAADGLLHALDWRVERAGWWAEIFNLPCAVYVARADEIVPLAESGADMLCFGPWLFDAPDAGDLIETAVAALSAQGAPS